MHCPEFSVNFSSMFSSGPNIPTCTAYTATKPHVIAYIFFLIVHVVTRLMIYCSNIIIPWVEQKFACNSPVEKSESDLRHC